MNSHGWHAISVLVEPVAGMLIVFIPDGLRTTATLSAGQDVHIFFI